MSQKEKKSVGHSPWTFQLFYFHLHKEKIIYSSLDDGKTTLFTEPIKNSILPVLPSLDCFLYLLIEIGFAVPFLKLLLQNETKNFCKGHGSHPDSSPTERFCLAGKHLKIDRVWES